MKHLTRLEQLYYLKWFLNEQIKNDSEELKEVDEEIKVLERKKNDAIS